VFTNNVKTCLFNKSAALLFLLSLALNFFYLFWIEKSQYVKANNIILFSDMAYNLCKHKTLKYCPKRAGHLLKEKFNGRDYSFSSLKNPESFGSFYKYRNIYDTVGYGVVLASLWKITKSWNYLDIQILQILIFSLLMFLIYKIGFLIFKNSQHAFILGMSFLMFLPLLPLNIEHSSDIWIYYSIILLFYAMAKIFYSSKQPTLISFILLSIGITICQWCRPTTFSACIFFVCFLMFNAIFINRNKAKTITIFISSFLLVNLFVFWIPFMAYNKAAYGQYIVGVSGSGLFVGLGEYKNKWGFKINDEFFREYIFQKYGFNYGTIEADKKGLEEAVKLIKEEPLHYLSCVARRVPYLLFPYSMTVRRDYFLKNKNTPTAKRLILNCMNSFGNFCDLVKYGTFKWYGYLYLLFYFFFAYFGIYLCFKKHKYRIIIFSLGVLTSSWIFIFSHIEDRYIIPFYSVLAIFVAFSIISMKNFINNKLKQGRQDRPQ
jgi:hypothetical protein